MSIADSILSGSLLLGQDLSWHGEKVLTGLCLYTDESTESSQVCDVTFQLEAIVNLTAIKLFMLKRDRWKVGNIDSNSKITKFLSEIFNNEGTNLSGTTKKGLLIKVVNKQQLILLYGERLESTLFIYAQPLFDNFDFSTIYSSVVSVDSNAALNEVGQMVLDEIFGNEFDYNNCLEIISPEQLIQPKNKLTELDLIHKLNQHSNSTRDLISEAKLARNKQQHRISKSKPTKHPSRNNLLEEKKNIVKRMIKDMLPITLKENKTMNTLIYSSIRTIYRKVLESSSTPLDESKLQCIVKMHIDFYNNLESMIDIFHPSA